MKISTPLLSLSPTHEFLRLVGSPFANRTRENFNSTQAKIQNASRLYHYATKNRMSLLYLEALKRLDILAPLRKEYNKLVDKYAKTNQAIYRVSQVLDRTGVNYTFFKSIRPYQEVTVDIDILVFGSCAEYEKVVQVLRRVGYVFLGSGPLSVTFRDSEAGINLDLYYEVGASHMIYLDKDGLERFVCERKLSNGELVFSLFSEADLLAVIAHSVVKEHMYVLSEYYTTLYYLADMEEEALKSFLSLVEKCKVRSAAKTHLGITALLHYEAHRFLPASLVSLLEMLGVNQLELSRAEKMGFGMPHKYHPITTIKALVEKLGEEKARRSFASQSLSMLNLKFTSSLMKEMLQHISRESY